MKKKRTRKEGKDRLSRVPLLVIIIGAAVVVVGAATVIKRQNVVAAKASIAANNGTNANGRFRTVKVAGREVQVDPQTGQIKPLTQQEAQQLADGLKQLVNRSTEGLTEVQDPDGGISMDLQGRFQNVQVARVNSDGTVTQSCIDSPEGAASFFQLDPKLLGVEKSTDQPQTAARTTSAKKLQ